MKAAALSALLTLALVGVYAGIDVETGSFAQKDSEILNVHMIAHTHDDVGWLKTVDQYYAGLKPDIQQASVNTILDTVTLALEQNKDRKFIYVEIGFFARWWMEQDEAKKESVRNLVKEGRFEFINGGWCMNDEAAPTYTDIIDQMTLGHRFLWDEFQVRPTIGWSIDPFGHSAAQASLFASMGFDAFFFARIDKDDRAKRWDDKEMEFMWRGSHSLAKETEIFTHVMYQHYDAPAGFNFDWGSNDAPIQDDPRLHDYNVDERADDFASKMRDMAGKYRTNNVLVPCGSDFQYSNAFYHFKNLDKLIKYMNANQDKYGMRLFYSTPSEYVKSVNKFFNENKETVPLPVQNGDIMWPYNDDQQGHAYWTGYFTSRAALKGYVRSRSTIMRAAESARVAANASGRRDTQYGREQYYRRIFDMQEAMGVLQHHDGVSGTSKQAVAEDYSERLAFGTASATDAFVDAIRSNLRGDADYPAVPQLQACPFLNETICDATHPLGDNQVIPVVAYNPLASDEMPEVVRVPHPCDVYGRVSVSNDDGTIASEEGKTADGKCFVAFEVNAPPMGHATYYLKASAANEKSVEAPKKSNDDNVVLDNGVMKATFSAAKGGLTSIQYSGMKEVPAKVEYLWYESSTGTSEDGQASGAYIFRPASDTPNPVWDGKTAPKFTFYDGKVLQELTIEYGKNFTTVVRLSAGSNQLVIQHQVGPLDITDGIGKEVIVRYSTGLNTGDTFLVDANGMEMSEHKLNYRSTWTANILEKVAGNYYPITEAIAVVDKSAGIRASVLVDRSVGGSSLSSGQMEVMVQRRMTKDDGRGVGEPLDETYGDVIFTTHTFALQNEEDGAMHRLAARRLANPHFLLFAPVISSIQRDFASLFRTRASTVLARGLPAQVHLQKLEDVGENGLVLLRLHHDFARCEPPKTMSEPVHLDLNTMFAPGIKVIEAHEQGMTANQEITDIHRLKWPSDNVTPAGARTPFDEMSTCASKSSPSFLRASSTAITLEPMETRTFLVKVKYQ